MNEKTEKAFRASKEDLSVAVRDEYGVAYSQDGKSLLKCENRELTEYVVREGTEVICIGAFNTCQALTSIKMPERGVVAIGADAFHFCTALKSINIPLTVNEIGEYAFAECYKLSSIVIPEGVTVINEATFTNCQGLEQVVLPASVTYYDDMAFLNCIALREVTVGATEPTKIPDDQLFDGANFDNCTLRVPKGAKQAYATTPVWQDFTHIEEID